MLRYFIGVAVNKHMDYPDVRYYQCKKVDLHSDENVLLHVDGELVGSLPASISVAEQKLKILVPKKIRNPLTVLKESMK